MVTAPPRAAPLDFDAWFTVEHLTGRTAVETGHACVPGGRVWWMRVGDGEGTPLLVLHGGPGSGHDSLLPLAALADERPVIFYDQLGCGRSEAPEDPSIYTVERSVEELAAVRQHLALRELDLFGHSWGTILAMEYFSQGRGAGVRRLVLSGAISSVPRFVAGARGLLDEVRRELVGQGVQSDDETLERAFHDRHFCRVHPEPGNVGRSAANLAKSIAYGVMNGPNEYTVTGVIRDWDRSADLGWIEVPTLVTTGEYDEVVPEVAAAVCDGIPNARLLSFPGCSHLVIDEDPIGYLGAVRRFLR